MNSLFNKAQNIKMVGTDIDGVWTDSKMYVTPDGEWMKAFSTYDGMATSMLQGKGIIVAILTGENSDVVLARAKKLKIEEVYVDEHEKLKRMNYLTKKYEISMDEVAFIGDDVNDLEVLAAVGLSAMAGNSPILNKFSPDYVTIRHGGNGAFREFADLIMNAQ
jgi:YrbI family 3-deoxy-D-manno-octulosonate 8-phosphate phosphatase|tara:strand:- start:280 stop:768 length:489 start_codon:yes stop_codon:yes gene_type:complete